MQRTRTIGWIDPTAAIFGPVLLLLLGYGTVAGQSDVIVQNDVPYVPGGANEQQMDLFLPSGEDFPIIMFVHGGSLVSMDRKDEPYAVIGNNFARNGIGFVSINYRLGSANRWPAMPEDVAAAFAWTRKNAERLHGDPTRIFLFGHSSGALLAAILSTDETYLAGAGCSLSDIAACIPMGTMLNPSYDVDSVPAETLAVLWERYRKRETYEGLFDSPAEYRDADPSRHVNAKAPPFLVLIAEAEQSQPPILEQAERFSRSMNEAGVPVLVEVLKNRKHMTAMTAMADPDDPTFLRIVDFVKSH